MRVAVLVVLMAVAAMASVSVDRAEFDAFRATYGKLYASDAEHELRFQIFRENIQFIRKHNAEYEAGKHTYNVAVNKYADWTRSERAALRGYKKNDNLQIPREHYKGLYTGVEGENLPSSVDWRDKNVVTDVKNQGDCGSCWSFSATAAIEGAHALSTGQLVSLSNQELIDCVMDGQYTCQTGGEMQDGFSYAIQNGMESWDDYPYCTCSGNGCQFNSNDVVATISGYQNVSSGSESALQSATANYPTISVAIDASHDSFQFYSTGVYNEPACSSTQLDHGVLVVGYGADDNNTPYWIVKNSWGTDWGQAGYIWMSRNKHNQCGIASDASFPTV